jgi:hypothetical protein
MLWARGFALIWGCVACWPALAVASDLSWSGPAECNQNEQLSFQIERALGAPLQQMGHVHLQVHVDRVTPSAKALLRIRDDAAGTAVKERLLEAPDCATLVDTLAVAITLAVEATTPEHAATAPVPAPASTNSSPPAHRSPSELRDTTEAAPVAREAGHDRLAPSVLGEVIGDSGSLPAPALGLALGARLGRARWQIEVVGTFWLEQQSLLDASGVAGAGARLDLATGGLVGCSFPLGSANDALALSLCAGFEAGRLAGVGTGVSAPRRASALWLAPQIDAGLTWSLPATRLGVEARIGAALPLERHPFELDRLGTVYQPASLAARASLGINVALE